MLSGLRRALSDVFPADCFLLGTRIEEKQRIFSIRPGTDEAALGVKLEPLKRTWPHGRGICDAVFIGALRHHPNLIISLVELKGSDVERALIQIKDTLELLCRSVTALLPVHGDAVIREVVTLNMNGHGRGILGIIVSKQGLTLTQKQKAELWNRYRLRIWPCTGQLRQVSCRDLASRFDSFR